MKKSKQSITKSSKTKLNTIQTDKLLISGKDVLTEKYLLEKAATTKRFECLPLESELKKQTSNAGIQYKRLEKTYKLDKNEYKTSKKEKPAVIS